jgi:hypothetical protein
MGYLINSFRFAPVIVSNEGTFVVISQNGTNRLMTSLNGINWTLRTLPTATYINIAYSDDLDLFVVEDSGGEIITSSDGTTWTSRTKPADISSAKHNCVKWAKSIGEFISVKASGTDRLARSSDGINWTSDTFISATFEGLCYSDDLGMLVAYGLTGATGSAAIIYTSTDGTNWTSRTPFRTDSTSVIRKMIWIPELGRFVAGDSAGRFQTSTDGITWTDYGSVTNMGNVYSLAYSADLDVIVALASSGTARAASRAGTAGAWTSRTIGTQTWFQVEYDEYTQVFSAVATDGRATYSTNGTTWATATTPQANTWFGMVIVNGKIVRDPDAQAFLTAASITDPTITTAIDNFVVGMKTDGLWSKMTGLYPFVGGTADTHKWNLKDPRDLDAAYRLNFVGTFTHNSNGITGTQNSAADTFINPSVVDNQRHMSVYVRGNDFPTPVINQYEMGLFVAGGNEWGLIGRYSNNLAYAGFGATFTSVSSTDARGFWTGIQEVSTVRLLKNGTQVVSASATVTNSNAKIGVGGQLTSAGVPRTGLCSIRNISFASVGALLTTAEVALFNTRVQALQTALSRNV